MASFPLTDQVRQALYAGWTDGGAIQGDWNNVGDSKYASYIKQGGMPLSTDPGAVSIENNAKQQKAQEDYKAATDKAVSGLQTQKNNLGQQYSDLLKTVKGQYDPLIAQETATLGAAESGRGLTPDSALFQQQVQGGLAPVYGQEAANAQQIGQGSISDTNALTSNIANLQAGVAGTASQLPLQYGGLALQQQQMPSTIAAALAQANAFNAQAKSASFVPTGVPGITFNAANNTSSLLGNPIQLSQIQRILGIS